MKKFILCALLGATLFETTQAMITSKDTSSSSPVLKLPSFNQIFDPKDQVKVLSIIVNDKILKVNEGNCSMDIAINEVLNNMMNWFQERFELANQKSSKLVYSSKTVTDIYKFIEQKDLEIEELKSKIKKIYNTIPSEKISSNSTISRTNSILKNVDSTISASKNTLNKTTSFNICLSEEINLFIRSSVSAKIEHMFSQIFSKKLNLSDPIDQEVVSLFVNRGILFIFLNESKYISESIGSRFSFVMKLTNQSSKQLKEIYNKSFVLLNTLLSTLESFETLVNQKPRLKL